MRDDDLLRYVEDNTLITHGELRKALEDIAAQIMGLVIVLTEAGVIRSSKQHADAVTRGRAIIDQASASLDENNTET